jgi:hypothetical protein
MTRKPAHPETASKGSDAGPDVVLARHRGHRAIRGAALQLNLTPMIDVVFLLMIYFLLVTNFARSEEAMGIDLPDPLASSAQTDPFEIIDEPVVIHIRSTGDAETAYRLRVDHPTIGAVSSYEGLYASLHQGRFDQGGYLFAENQQFILDPVRDARWEHTVATLNAVLRAGFTQISFADPEATP